MQDNQLTKKALRLHVWKWLRDNFDSLKTLRTQEQVYNHFIATQSVNISKTFFTQAMYSLGFTRRSVRVMNEDGSSTIAKKYFFTSPNNITLREELEHDVPINLESTKGDYEICVACGGAGVIRKSGTSQTSQAGDDELSTASTSVAA